MVITSQKSVIYILSLSTLILFSSIFLPGLLLDSNDSNNHIDDVKHGNSISESAHSKDPVLNRANHCTRSTRGEGDFIVYGDQNREFNTDRLFNNVTIRDEATLIIKDCEFIINGSLKVMDNARLFIINSTVWVKPGPKEPKEIVINFSNQAKVQITDSTLYTLPQPTLTNISYLLSDDSVEVTIIRSYLNIRLPAIENMDIELTPPTAGTFILTGDSVWYMHNCTIEGYLSHNESDILDGRWFIFTIQRNAKLYMKDTVGDMEEDETQPFIKLIAGYVRLENVVIRHGVIDNEVVGEIEIYNLTITNLNLRDQSKSKVVRSTIKEYLDVGNIAAIYTTHPENYTYGQPENNTEDLAKSYLYMEDSIIGTPGDSEGTILAVGNSTSTILHCSIKKCYVTRKAKVSFEDCNIKQLVEGGGNGKITIIETEIPQVFLNDDSDLFIYGSSGSKPVDRIITRYNCKSNIYIEQMLVRNIDIWAGDNIIPEDYGPGYNPDKNVSEVKLTMIDSDLVELILADDAKLSLILDSSTITEFVFDKVKNESVRISILDLASKYSIPESWPDVDLEIDILHRIFLSSTLNNNPISANFIIYNEQSEEVYRGKTSEDNSTGVNLLFKKYRKTGATPAGEYSLEFSYLGFSKNVKSQANMGDNYQVDWIDKNPPVITNVQIDTRYQQTQRGAFIQATIIDSDVKLVANATIYYQSNIDGTWSDWKKSTMIEIENDTFEGAISKNVPGAKFRFYIEAYDILGNRITTKEFSYKLDNTGFYTNLYIVILIIVIIFLFMLYFIRRRTKVRKYLNKPKSGK